MNLVLSGATGPAAAPVVRVRHIGAAASDADFPGRAGCYENNIDPHRSGMSRVKLVAVWNPPRTPCRHCMVLAARPGQLGLGTSPDSSEHALAFRPGRNRTPFERGGDGRFTGGAERRPPGDGVRQPSKINCSQPPLITYKLWFMLMHGQTEDAGHARLTFRLRVSSLARAELMGEWCRCRCRCRWGGTNASRSRSRSTCITRPRAIRRPVAWHSSTRC